MNKYSTKRSINHTSFDSYNNKHRRDYSPKSRSHSRNSSPESWSPRGSYQYKYSRKSKDRDTKYYDGCNKSKYMKLSRSPGHESSKSIRNSSGNSKEYIYGNGHSSSSPLKKFGDWSAQISSSGKRYYYNIKTEVSQWHKPKEWLEYEKRHSSRYSSSSLLDKHGNHRDKFEIENNNPKSYAYSNDIHKIKESYTLKSPNSRSHYEKIRSEDKVRLTNDDKKSKNDLNDCFISKTICNNNHNSQKLDNDKIKKNEMPTSSQTNDFSEILNAIASIVSTGQSPLKSLEKLFTKSSGINKEKLLLIKKNLLKAQQQNSKTNSRNSNNVQTNHSPNLQTKHSNKIDGIRQDHDQPSKKLNKSSTSNSSSSSDSKINLNRNNGLGYISSIINQSKGESIGPKSLDLSGFKHLYREDLTEHIRRWNTEIPDQQVIYLFIYLFFLTY